MTAQLRAIAPTYITPVETGSPSGFSTSDRETIRAVIQRDWRCHLKPAERDLISYICAASIERGYEVLDCTWEQLTRGVRVIGKTLTKWLIPPIGITRRTFYRLLDDLKHRGIITVAAVHRTCTRISINLDWTPEKGTMAPRMLISKRRAAELAEQENGATGCKTTPESRDLECQFGTPITIYNTDSSSPSEKNLRGSRPVGPTLPVPKRTKIGGATAPIPLPSSARPAREVLAAVIAGARSITADKAKQVTGKDSITAFRTTFAAAWNEANPNITAPGFTERETHMLRASLKSRFPVIADRHAFLTFVVRNWTQIIADKFGWMRQPAPQLPSLQFMLGARIMPTFMDAFAERKRYEASRLVSGEEAHIERLMMQGATRDEALVKVGERRALSKQAETKQATSGSFRFAERERARVVEDRKQLMREQAALPAPAAPPPPDTGFADELPPIDLPALPTTWNTPE